MIERILVPLDGTPDSEAVLIQVRRILRIADAEVLLLRALEIPPISIAYRSVRGHGVESAAAYLSAVEGPLAEAGIRTRRLIRLGSPANAIVDAARRERVSLVALSTRSRRGVARFLYGSVAERVIRRTPVPVVAVHPADAAGPAELPFRRIVAAVDGSGAAMDAVHAVRELAVPLRSEVILVHAAGRRPEQAPPEAAAAELRDAGVPVSIDLRRGRPEEAILAACREHQADLLAMATHGRRGLARLIAGSHTEAVLRRARLPLLIVRPADARRWRQVS